MVKILLRQKLKVNTEIWLYCRNIWPSLTGCVATQQSKNVVSRNNSENKDIIII